MRTPKGAELALLDVPGGALLQPRVEFTKSHLPISQQAVALCHRLWLHLPRPGSRRCRLASALFRFLKADVAMLVISAKGRELEAALKEARSAKKSQGFHEQG